MRKRKDEEYIYKFILFAFIAIITVFIISGCGAKKNIEEESSAFLYTEVDTEVYTERMSDESTTVEDMDWGTPGEEYYYEYYEEPPVIDFGYAEYTPHDLMYFGEIYWGGWRFTWYSENVLPGGGLDIPGRWSDGDFVRDCYGNICCASEDLPYSSTLDTPWGTACVYDCGCSSGTIDIYTSW